MLHIKTRGCLFLSVSIMLKKPFTAKQPKSHIETSLGSMLFADVIESIIATGPEIAKRKAIKLSTKLFIIELFMPILFQASNNLIFLLNLILNLCPKINILS